MAYRKKQPQHTVKLTCLPRSLTERKVYQFIKEHKAEYDMTGFKVFDGYSLVNYGCRDSCERARLKLNGKAMGRMLVKAKIKGSHIHSTNTVHTVKINHLSPAVTEEDLHEICARFGTVSSIKVNNLYAYVNLETRDSATNIVKYLNSGIELGGQTVTASIHDGSKYEHSPSLSPIKHVKAALPTGPSCTVKVTLNRPLLSEDLLEYFSSFGTVEGEVKVHSGSPDFAYINFSSPLEASEACKEKTVMFKNVTLSIKLSNKARSIHVLQLSNGLVDQLLIKSSDLEKKLLMFNVSVDKLNDRGLSIKGSPGDISRVKLLLESMTSAIEAKLVKKSKKLHYCSAPLLLDLQLFETLSQKHCVEFKIKRTNGTEENIAVFCDMFAHLHSKPRMLSKVDLFGSYINDNQTQTYTWSFKDKHNGGRFTAMSQTYSDAVEDCYQSYCVKDTIITYTHYNGTTCEYDFKRMIETNLDTEEDRELRRDERKVGSRGITLVCRGYEEATSVALSELESALGAEYRYAVVDVTDGKYISKIVDLAGEYCVEIELSEKLPGQVSLKGKQECVDVASIDIKVKLGELKSKPFP